MIEEKQVLKIIEGRIVKMQNIAAECIELIYNVECIIKAASSILSYKDDSLSDVQKQLKEEQFLPPLTADELIARRASVKNTYCVRCDCNPCSNPQKCYPIDMREANCPHGIAMDIYCENCDNSKIVGTKYIGPQRSRQDNTYATEIWNAAIEAAVKYLEVNNLDQNSNADIVEIRKLKK